MYISLKINDKIWRWSEYFIYFGWVISSSGSVSNVHFNINSRLYHFVSTLHLII